jgi:hypothetical protein
MSKFNLFDAAGSFQQTAFINLARDLTVVQAVRRGIDVPLTVLDEVKDVGKCMVALEEAEQLEKKEREENEI